MADREATQSAPVWRIHRVESIDSTNRFVLDEARAGAEAGLVAVADHQTEGRGRRGRAWIAPPGSSLLVSVLLRPRIDSLPVQVCTMAAGLALAEAVEQVAGFAPALKWPNDLVVGDRKLAGLLAESDVSSDGEVRALVLGAGCNVNWPPTPEAGMPKELVTIATACNLEAGRAVDRDVLLDAFLDRLTARVGDLAAVVPAYRARLATLGREVHVDLGATTIEGTATDLDAAGRLVVTTADGAQVTVAVGDVVHLRPRLP